GGTNFIDDDALAVADLALEAFSRNLLLALHETVPALLLDRLGDRRTKIVRHRATDRLVAKAADTVELGLAEPVEQSYEIRFRFAGKANNEGRTDGEVRAALPPLADALERALLRRRPPHAF